MDVRVHFCFIPEHPNIYPSADLPNVAFTNAARLKALELCVGLLRLSKTMWEWFFVVLREPPQTEERENAQ
ncbi:MAG TPA: hypothetical protein VEI52_03895 [Terriglobales bacterium]|nr:hypothetical protein [Terriglobales bacterium]